mgnify:CR=1 FL=1|jgi:hypothetical protein
MQSDVLRAVSKKDRMIVYDSLLPDGMIEKQEEY